MDVLSRPSLSCIRMISQPSEWLVTYPTLSTAIFNPKKMLNPTALKKLSCKAQNIYNWISVFFRRISKASRQTQNKKGVCAFREWGKRERVEHGKNSWTAFKIHLDRSRFLKILLAVQYTIACTVRLAQAAHTSYCFQPTSIPLLLF